MKTNGEIGTLQMVQKAKPNVEAKQNMLLGQLQERLLRLEGAASKSFQRTSWLKVNGDLINCEALSRVSVERSKVFLHFNDDTMLTISPADFPNIEEMAGEVGEKAYSDACSVIFGWIVRTLVDCGCGLLDIDAHVQQLKLAGKEPVDASEQLEAVSSAEEAVGA